MFYSEPEVFAAAAANKAQHQTENSPEDKRSHSTVRSSEGSHDDVADSHHEADDEIEADDDDGDDVMRRGFEAYDEGQNSGAQEPPLLFVYAEFSNMLSCKSALSTLAQL